MAVLELVHGENIDADFVEVGGELVAVVEADGDELFLFEEDRVFQYCA